MKSQREQISQQPNIIQTANLDSGGQTLKANSEIGNLISNFGNQVLTSSGQKLASQNALEDIDKQQKLIAAGENGQFSNVNGIVEFLNPTYAKTYNTVMDSIATPILNASVSAKIVEQANLIKSNAEIPVEQKTQLLSKQLNETLPKLLQDIPEDYKTKVGASAYAQSGQEVVRMAAFTADIQLKQNYVVSEDAKIQHGILGANANSLTEANNAMAEIKAIDDSLLAIGAQTALQHKASQERFKSLILGQQAVKAGVTNVKSWVVKNGIELSPEIVDGIQNYVTQNYAKTEQLKEIALERNGFNHQLQLAKLRNGENINSSNLESNRQVMQDEVARYMGAKGAEELANRQLAQLQEAQNIGYLTNIYKNMTEVQRFNLRIGNYDKLPAEYENFNKLFESLPDKGKNEVIKNVKNFSELVKTSPLEALEVPDEDFQNQFNILANKGVLNQEQINYNLVVKEATLARNVPPEKIADNIISPNNLKDLQQIAMQNPVLADQIIQANYGDKYTPVVRSKLQNTIPEQALGYSLLSVPNVPKEFQSAYLNKPATTNLSNNSWLKKELKSSTYEALSNLSPQSIQNVLGMVNGVREGSGNTIAPQKIIDGMFDVFNGGLVAKGDKDHLTSTEFQIMSKKININPDNWVYYPETDVYRAIDSDGTPTNNLITGKSLREFVPEGWLSQWFNRSNVNVKKGNPDGTK